MTQQETDSMTQQDPASGRFVADDEEAVLAGKLALAAYEALDCRVYARAAAWIAGADRWTDEKWRDLEDQLGVADTSADPAGQINRQAQTSQGKRRSDWLGRRGGWF